jgi:hypothetical protein
MRSAYLTERSVKKMADPPQIRHLEAAIPPFRHLETPCIVSVSCSL